MRLLVAGIIVVTAVASLSMGAVKNTFAAEPIAIGNASPGGPSLAYSQSLVPILSRVLGQEFIALATQGPIQNIQLLEKNEIQIAVITTGVGLQAWNGTDWAKGTKYRSWRVLFPMYGAAFQFMAAKRLHIHRLQDLANLRIGLGPPGGTGGAHTLAVFKALNIEVIARYGAVNNFVSQLTSEDFDGLVLAGGYPAPVVGEIDAMGLVDFIQPSDEQVAIVAKQMPEFSAVAVPAGTYPSLLKDYHTIGTYTFAVVHKDFPEDLAYRIVKAVFDNREELARIQPLGKGTIPEKISLNNPLLPLHPGAIRYFHEIGISVPTESTP